VKTDINITKCVQLIHKLPIKMLQLNKIIQFRLHAFLNQSLLALLLLFSLNQGISQESCSCSLTLSSGTTYLKGLVQGGQLPNTGTASDGCIKVPNNSTLVINVNYTFDHYNFQMGTGAKIVI
jgi:hypothetical protein